jgi:hypothetical protein
MASRVSLGSLGHGGSMAWATAMREAGYEPEMAGNLLSCGGGLDSWFVCLAVLGGLGRTSQCDRNCVRLSQYGGQRIRKLCDELEWQEKRMDHIFLSRLALGGIASNPAFPGRRG